MNQNDQRDELFQTSSSVSTQTWSQTPNQTLQNHWWEQSQNSVVVAGFLIFFTAAHYLSLQLWFYLLCRRRREAVRLLTTPRHTLARRHSQSQQAKEVPGQRQGDKTKQNSLVSAQENDADQRQMQGNPGPISNLEVTELEASDSGGYHWAPKKNRRNASSQSGRNEFHNPNATAICIERISGREKSAVSARQACDVGGRTPSKNRFLQFTQSTLQRGVFFAGDCTWASLQMSRIDRDVHQRLSELFFLKHAGHSEHADWKSA